MIAQRVSLVVGTILLLLIFSGCQLASNPFKTVPNIAAKRFSLPKAEDAGAREQRLAEKQLDQLGGAFYVQNGERVVHLWRIRDEGFTANRYRDVTDFDRVIDCLRRLGPLHRIQTVPKQDAFVPKLREAFPETEITVWDQKGLI